MNDKLGKNTWLGFFVTWELIYFVLFITTVVHNFPVNGMDKVHTSPFKLLHAVFWLREEYDKVIKKDIGSVGSGHFYLCSKGQQWEIDYSWGGRGVGLFPCRCWEYRAQLGRNHLSKCVWQRQEMRNEAHVADERTSQRLSGWGQWNLTSHSQKGSRKLQGRGKREKEKLKY